MTSTDITAETTDQIIENEEKNKKGWLKRAFAKAGDIAGRAAVTNLVKIGAVSVMAGAGASAVLTVAGAAVATGVGAALYTYGRDSWKARREAATNGTEFKWLDYNRLKAARLSLLCGVAGGALGAWLASSDTVQWVVKWGIEKVGDGFESLSGVFSGASAPETVAAAAGAAVEAKATVLSRLSQAVAEYGGADSRLSAWLSKIDLGNLDSVSPQALKDAAHDVLRIEEIPQDERFALARELATEAQARGNAQAEGFLRDLASLEAGETPASAPAVAATPVADASGAVTMKDSGMSPEFIAEMEKMLAELDGETETPATTTTEAAPAETTSSPIIEIDPSVFEGDDTVTAPVASIAPIAPVFAQEAAVCNVTVNAPAGVAVDVSCTVSKPEMAAGDFIRFTDGAGQSVTTDLLAGSERVETRGFLQGPVVADGVDRLTRKVGL